MDLVPLLCSGLVMYRVMENRQSSLQKDKLAQQGGSPDSYHVFIVLCICVLTGL